MWRNGNKVTGTNDAPLGAPRRWGGGQSDPKEAGAFGGLGAPTSYTSAPTTNREEELPPPPPPAANAPEPPPTERKRKSRWGAETEKVDVAGLPVAINGTIDTADLDRYAANLRLEHVNTKLRSGDVVPPERERSPSPPPTYDGQGRRTNTREFRYRRKLEEERTKLIERLIKIDPSYRPPPDFEAQKKFGGNRSGRPSDKVYIPIKEFPEIKFFGLLVGPRGNSLKKMETESGAKISIRGRGSVKEGKGRKEEFAGDDDDEMHCLVTAETQEKVDKCVKLINKVIETACSVPESQNEQKLNQLRELAQLNGTFRDFENQVCQNCGNPGHRKYDCPEQRNFSAGIICRICGGAGHMARDCTQRRGFNGNTSGAGVAQAFDSEYASLMAELGETSKVAPVSEEGANGKSETPNHQTNWSNPTNSSTPARNGGETGSSQTNTVPPWRIPSNWHPPQPPTQHHGGNYVPRSNYVYNANQHNHHHQGHQGHHGHPNQHHMHGNHHHHSQHFQHHPRPNPQQIVHNSPPIADAQFTPQGSYAGYFPQ
ncbi:hypothetical protein BY996DRAFT_6430879 [Phakopsora pachyrhizi]|uniref:Branchpoint-bridging protein n=1 Tax=Phakopsora pachyrhizi TaxID=170000 RepID=A0AAV0ANN6_PHAPC|nr:hypothetical protein BY996DRAFT_6436217 [Phakopsora pachyrhizi]KAI8456108.1 hypothetical protein BY996DRAFT_6430879 [Phakopsora pachyrhizi]CAH7669585.1 hypothetical protein PPACK8108_LOCUS4224 [Phakopsora pachyrhizi]